MRGLLHTVTVEVLARSLSAAVTCAGWGLDRFADYAEPTGRALTEAADAARYWATASRAVP